MSSRVSKREWVKEASVESVARDDPSAFPGCPGASVDRLTSRIRAGWKVESTTRRPARVDRWLPSRDVSPTFVPGEIHPGRRQSGGRWTVRRTSRPPYGEAGGGEGGAVEEEEEEGPRTCNKLRGSRRRRRRYYRRHRCRRHRPRHDVTWIS